LDFVSKSKNGTQEVYGAYYKAEYEKLATGRKANDEIRSLTRVLLNLKVKFTFLFSCIELSTNKQL